MIQTLWYEKFNPEHPTLYSPADLAAVVQSNVEYHEERAERYKAEADKTRDEIREEVKKNYENEIASLKKELSLSFFSFASDKELDNFKDFCNRHKSCWNGKKITSGNGFYIKPYYTGFSTSVTACCPHCGKEEAISDTSVW